MYSKGTPLRTALRTVLFLAIFFIFSSSFAGEVIKEACFKDVCIQAEVADNDLSRRKGLMFKESLSSDQGMLFIFDNEDIHSFWMKNMKFPLDIIWISEDKRTVYIKTDVEPCKEVCNTMIPKEKAKYVLEVNSGFVDTQEIKIGDQVSFN
ncbi:MAG: DUF192 domain-containing protein [Candidatus Omnitrophota bacterium]